MKVGDWSRLKLTEEVSAGFDAGANPADFTIPADPAMGEKLDIGAVSLASVIDGEEIWRAASSTLASAVGCVSAAACCATGVGSNAEAVSVGTLVRTGVVDPASPSAASAGLPFGA